MIIEKEKKLEIIDDDKNIAKNNEQASFTQIPNTSHHTVKNSVIAISIFLVIFLGLILTIFLGFTFYNYSNNSVISKGIYINGVDVSNLTIAEAKFKLDEYYKDKLSNDITLVHNDYTTYIKSSEIELTVDTDSAVRYAYSYGKSSNIIKDNFEVFHAMINGINIMPKITYNEENLKNILTKLSAELPDAVVESGYYIDNNSLIITKGKDGNIIDVNSTLESIDKKLSNLSYLNEIIDIKTLQQSPEEVNLDSIHNEIFKEAKDAYYTTDPYVIYPSETGIDFKISVDEAKELLKNSEEECTIPLKALYPKVTTNMIGGEAFPDKLASFSTKYAASNTNRTTNLRLAASKIDGYVLLPGETFSYNAVVGERTIAAGYKEAAIYENGQVVDGLGGGICQISTTLCNAILFANLEIVELHNHQFVPSYVKAGRDATVVYGVKDFKFKNSRNYAVKITCSVSNGIANFEIWGLKEDVEYDVDVYANITSRSSSYIKSSTYRTLKLNGEIIKTENIMNATYKAH